MKRSPLSSFLLTYFDDSAEKSGSLTGAQVCPQLRQTPSTRLFVFLKLQVWRGALARMRCQRLRAIYAIMGCYKRYKVKAHFWEVESRFANARNLADYGKSVEWPSPPAALSQFHNITVMLHRRSGLSPHIWDLWTITVPYLYCMAAPT